jgi:hypothetical protein
LRSITDADAMTLSSSPSSRRTFIAFDQIESTRTDLADAGGTFEDKRFNTNFSQSHSGSKSADSSSDDYDTHRIILHDWTGGPTVLNYFVASGCGATFPALA